MISSKLGQFPKLLINDIAKPRSHMTDADEATIADLLQINAAFAPIPLDARRLSRPRDESHR